MAAAHKLAKGKYQGHDFHFVGKYKALQVLDDGLFLRLGGENEKGGRALFVEIEIGNDLGFAIKQARLLTVPDLQGFHVGSGLCLQEAFCIFTFYLYKQVILCQFAGRESFFNHLRSTLFIG